MFLESLLETSTQAKTRRGWATLTSFLIETAVIGVLILVPMLYTDALPSLAYAGGVPLLVPPHGDPGPPTTPRETTHHPAVPPSDVNESGALVAPLKPPTRIWKPKPGEDISAPGPSYSCVGCIPEDSGRSDGPMNPILKSALKDLPLAKPQPPTAPVVLTSKMTEGMLIRRVQPVYPQMAIITRVQGSVVVHAIIGRDGVIRQWQVASGHPLLVGAAVDAIRQWRYRPYYLNGQAVEVETEITVNFVLNR